MTQLQIYNAYNSLKSIVDARLDAKKARDIYFIIKTLEPTYEFIIKRQNEIVKKYNAELNQDGTIKFKSQEVLQDFEREMKELESLDANIEVNKLTLSDSDLEKIEFSVRDILYLDGIVEFKSVE
ncbi:MAG: hypothetical protein LBS36_03390 [Oscillospiraceae bacterium]|jgi:hypothetical protein|nr:hypothetical protein [Oscillospiraceae bacterium]